MKKIPGAIEGVNMWRPADWKCPFTLKATVNGVSYQDAFEAGADFMLRSVVSWIRNHEELEMCDDPENFEYFCIPSKDLAELEAG